MKKTHLIIVNIILLLWYFLSMIGLKIGDKYLVTGAFEEEWLFMLIPTITFVLMLVTQFLSHEWYTLFGRGFMGEMDKKIAYFSECIQLINVDGRYVPDVYHIVLHILIIIAFVVTLLYREEKTLVDEV